jgi:hypothetical protein
MLGWFSTFPWDVIQMGVLEEQRSGAVTAYVVVPLPCGTGPHGSGTHVAVAQLQ